MTITTIKISQEVNFMGMPTWIGMEATILPDENEKDGLRQLQKSITEYLQEEKKTFKGKWKKPDDAQVINEPSIPLIDQIESCTQIKVLESYRLIAKTSPVSQQAYDNKLKQLQNA